MKIKQSQWLRGFLFFLLLFVLLATFYLPHSLLRNDGNDIASNSCLECVLKEMLLHFENRTEEKWLSINVSGFDTGFEGTVSNGTTPFNVALFVYGNFSECMDQFRFLKSNLTGDVINGSENRFCMWELLGGDESYYIECSEFKGTGVLIVVNGHDWQSVAKLTWRFPTQRCIRPGTRIVIQTGHQ
ncbi:hypothetical protein [Thermococcus sp.]|uniref:hypothetical protein n=1 Tax=Thermococcus sp. TaxID=35749 RepID=UPI002628FB88|nr:hypothetical protein [Thermococcus sp.]